MKVAEILDYANQNDIRLWADGSLLRVDAPRKAMTPEFQSNLKQHKPELIKQLTDPDETARLVQYNLKEGVPTLVDMRGIGRAYWVRDEGQQEELQAQLLAQGDNTPVFAWGELVLIKDLSLEDKRNVYELKRRFQGEIENVEPNVAE